MKRNKKKNRQLALLILLLSITIGFALLSTTLYINGTAGIKSNTWDIHWENVQPNAESTVTAETPVISEHATKVSYEVTLELPGDFYEFTVDAKNDGSINGEITKIDHNVYVVDATTGEVVIDQQTGKPQTATLPSYIKYSIYYDGTTTPPAMGDLLASGEKQTYRIRIEYDSEATTLPESDLTYKVEDEITYTQSKQEPSEDPDKCNEALGCADDTSVTGLWFYEINNDGEKTASIVAINENYDAEMTALSAYFHANGSEDIYEQTVWDDTLDDYVPYDHDNITPEYIKNIVIPSKVKLNAQGIEDTEGEEYTVTRFYGNYTDNSSYAGDNTVLVSQAKATYIQEHHGVDFYSYIYAPESMVFPDTITFIGDVGAGWYNLSKIRFSDNITKFPDFGSYCGYGYGNPPFVDIVRIPSHVTEIHDGRLCNCKYKNVYIPATVTDLTGAFCRSGWSEGTTFIPENSEVAQRITGAGETAGTNESGAVATHTNTSCSDTTPPTCQLNYVNELTNGFGFSFSCTDDTKIKRITSLFDSDPYSGQYDSSSFDNIGTIKNGTISNAGKTSSYSSRWTTASSAPPSRGANYYFSYGAEDDCGNWVVYHTNRTYSY